MRFYLGTSKVGWLDRVNVPLFLSRRSLEVRKTLPRATAAWALDSGGFSEISLHGRWTLDAAGYIRQVRRYQEEIGGMEWAACQDWMCEPWMLAHTGLSLAEHQRRTVANAVELRDRAPDLPWMPVLQGWGRDDYLRCWELYERAGIALAEEALVGLGSVCRRQHTRELPSIVEALSPLHLHAFGVKLTGIMSVGHRLASSDSMAWSFHARRRPPLAGCSHRNCANCLRYALWWRERALRQIEQSLSQPRQLVFAL